MGEKMQIVILHISHRVGEDLWAFRTKEGAKAQLARYCREWWKKELNGTALPMPKDDDELIRFYFANTDESYEIQQATLHEGETMNATTFYASENPAYLAKKRLGMALNGERRFCVYRRTEGEGSAVKLPRQFNVRHTAAKYAHELTVRFERRKATVPYLGD